MQKGTNKYAKRLKQKEKRLWKTRARLKQNLIDMSTVCDA